MAPISIIFEYFARDLLTSYTYRTDIASRKKCYEQ